MTEVPQQSVAATAPSAGDASLAASCAIRLLQQKIKATAKVSATTFFIWVFSNNTSKVWVKMISLLKSKLLTYLPKSTTQGLYLTQNNKIVSDSDSE